MKATFGVFSFLCHMILVWAELYSNFKVFSKRKCFFRQTVLTEIFRNQKVSWNVWKMESQLKAEQQRWRGDPTNSTYHKRGTSKVKQNKNKAYISDHSTTTIEGHGFHFKRNRVIWPLFSATIAVVIWWGVLEMADTLAIAAHSPSVEFIRLTWATSGLVDRL